MPDEPTEHRPETDQGSCEESQMGCRLFGAIAGCWQVMIDCGPECSEDGGPEVMEGGMEICGQGLEGTGH